MPVPIRVFALMMQPLLSLGLKAVFNERPGYGWMNTDSELALQERLSRPQEGTVDLLLTDRVEDLENRPEWLASLRKCNPSLRILVLLSAYPSDVDIVKALRTGANGYLLQTANEELLLQALEAIVQGGSYIQPQVTPVVLAELRKPHHLVMSDCTGIELSDRERMLIQLAADGLSNVQIADVLGLREKTIRNLWSSLFERLGIADRTQAVLWAIRTGYAELR